MKANTLRTTTQFLGFGALCFGAGTLCAADLIKADNADNLNLSTSWALGGVPGAADVAVWDGTVTSASSTLLGADLGWAGLRIASPGGAVSIGAGNTLTLGASGIDMSAATQGLTLANGTVLGAAQNWNVGTGVSLVSSGSVTLNNLLTKTGAGNLTLSAANTGAGGLTLSSGTLALNNTGAAGSGAVTLNGGTLSLGADIGNAFNIAGNVMASIGANRVIGGGSGAVSGSGTLTFSGLTSGRIFTINGSMAGFTGTIDLGASAGTLRFNSGGGNNALGNAGAIFDLGSATGSMQMRNGSGTYSLGELRGGAGTRLTGPGSADGTGTYSIGGLGTSSTFEGTMMDSNPNVRRVAVTKVGTGVLTLTGTNTYSGVTTVSAGTLNILGRQDGTNTVTVAATGTLAGTGSIFGNTTVNGDLAPGDAVGSPIGSLTFSSNVSLAGVARLELDRNNSQNADLINVVGTLTISGGSLVVANVGGAPLLGDSFNLIDGTISGTFASITLPGLSGGLDWDQSQLYSAGILSVVSAVPEPSALGLALVGGLGLVSLRRRRRS
jgi:autotransporter-associated beta strand protein